jgi:hypothetical protein
MLTAGTRGRLARRRENERVDGFNPDRYALAQEDSTAAGTDMAHLQEPPSWESVGPADGRRISLAGRFDICSDCGEPVSIGNVHLCEGYQPASFFRPVRRSAPSPVLVSTVVRALRPPPNSCQIPGPGWHRE